MNILFARFVGRCPSPNRPHVAPAWVPSLLIAALSGLLFAALTSVAQDAGRFWDGRSGSLQGVAIGNDVWALKEDVNPAQNTVDDYVRLRGLGLNLVRFYLSYKFFERDAAPYEYKQAGWDFVNQNLAWAKANGIKFILNIHVPQGGFQSNGEGAALWDVEENQKRLVALWREIAKRYADEPDIVAYDILNEPVVSKDKSQWQRLAQRIVNAIREVDPNHLIYVERINGSLAGGWANDDEMNFVFISDPANKWGLTFHFYSPISYTHQYAVWVPGFKDTDGGKYPDPALAQFDNDVWKGATWGSPQLPKGNSDWAYYTGEWKTVTDLSEGNIGRPAMQCERVGDGTAWFDTLVLEKKAPDGTVSTVATYKLPFKNGAWYFWKGKGDSGKLVETEQAVGITGTTSDAGYSSPVMFAALEQGCAYRASGRMRGENIPEGAICKIRFDWHHAKNVGKRDKAFLAREVDAYMNIAKAKNLPVYLGEFGVIKATLADGKGGTAWAADMFDILKSRGVPFTYHAWVDHWFGVKGNAELEALFKATFNP